MSTTLDISTADAAGLVSIQAETFTTPDGWIIDVETGEVLGCVPAEHFAVTDASGADWVLEKLQDADALILCEEAKLRAITECIQSRITVQKRRRDWLQKRFGPELEHFAHGQLEGGKSRTLVLDHGKISFRKTPGSTKILDMQAALDWAHLNCDEAIVTSEHVIVTPLKGRDDLPEHAFAVTPAGERCTIDTCIK